jgi:20S proteasome subunit beta 7
LGTVDKIGTCYYDGQIATSMGTHLALPLLRERAEKYGPKMTEKQAREALLDAMRTLYYRDGRAYPRIQIAKVTADGVEIEAPTQITSNWEIGFMVE